MPKLAKMPAWHQFCALHQRWWAQAPFAIGKGAWVFASVRGLCCSAAQGFVEHHLVLQIGQTRLHQRLLGPKQ